jgi:hypothetical protein
MFYIGKIMIIGYEPICKRFLPILRNLRALFVNPNFEPDSGLYRRPPTLPTTDSTDSLPDPVTAGLMAFLGV